MRRFRVTSECCDLIALSFLSSIVGTILVKPDILQMSNVFALRTILIFFSIPHLSYTLHSSLSDHNIHVFLFSHLYHA
ncbi:hypothetical protein C8R41DRAFT_602924 [Lentinula lateritia]|uniref:Uncharacterized protein n=1 Tax=Lentinula lateritia TaxID=40482 RepID=A0ABQ8V2M0_9AGAR|nr:hypothetical protein C8R41DRAFT_602924 [Lentinula lateritia]